MHDDLFAALHKMTLVAEYLEIKAELGMQGSEDPKFSPRHFEAAAGILKESESVLWNFIAELPRDQRPTAADTEAELRGKVESLSDDAPSKFAKALREDPGKVKAFIDSLPDPDMTTVGAEVSSETRAPGVDVGSVCNKCLTEEEKTRMSTDSDVNPISRDEADEQEFDCVRCGKRL